MYFLFLISYSIIIIIIEKEENITINSLSLQHKMDGYYVPTPTNVLVYRTVYFVTTEDDTDGKKSKTFDPYTCWLGR